MTLARSGRPGAAAAALLVILAITAAWWALALWPAGAATPEWLARTRAACFGTTSSGLPDTGGWILLIGEPIGMLTALALIWGDALRADLARIRHSRRWRTVAMLVVAAVAVGLAAAGRRVALATGIGMSAPATGRGVVAAADIDAAAIVLVDQHGRREALAGRLDGPALLTVAFGHCTTVCPTVVHQVRQVRQRAGRDDLPLIVVSLDPWRDTPARLPALARQWELDPGDLVLSGTVGEVNRALDHLQVSRRRDPRTGDIDHLATIFLLDPDARVTRRIEGGWADLGVLIAAVPDTHAPPGPATR